MMSTKRILFAPSLIVLLGATSNLLGQGKSTTGGFSSKVNEHSASASPSSPSKQISSVSSPSPVLFTTIVSKTSVSVGDRVVITYSAHIPAGASLTLDALVTPAPGEGVRPAGGAVLEFETPAPPTVTKSKSTTGDFFEWSQSVALFPFAAGAIVVPGPHYSFEEKSSARVDVRPPAVELSVASRLPKDQKQDALAPKADRPARIPAHPPLFWIAIGAAVLAAAALVWWLLRRRKKQADEEPVLPAIPPGEELLAALARLGREAEGLEGDPRAFYSDLTRAVKRYLERRLGEPVLEWTTFETIRRLREKNLELPRETGFAELLAAADRVKFGKGAATRDEARRHLERARVVHDFLEPRFAMEAVPAAAAGPASGKVRAS